MNYFLLLNLSKQKNIKEKKEEDIKKKKRREKSENYIIHPLCYTIPSSKDNYHLHESNLTPKSYNFTPLIEI